MVKKNSSEYFRAKGLLPYQVKFALNFLENEEERIWKLVAPAGTGKTRLAGALIAYEMEDGLNKRILVLSPRYILLQQLQTELSFAIPTITPLIVDRKTYLELESRVPVGESPWPLPAIIIMNINLAKRDDMAEKLSDVVWDFIIFNESHLLSGRQYKALFDQLTKPIATRALLLTSIEQQPISDLINRVRFEYSDIIDWNRQSLYVSFEKKLKLVYFQRTEEESAFLKKLQQFAGRIAYKWLHGEFLEKIILRAASSSIYTAERMLLQLQDTWRHIRNKIAHNIPLTDEDIKRVQQQFITFTDEIGVNDKEPYYDTSIHLQEFLTFNKELESLLNQLEEIPIDTKMNALISYIQEFYKANDKSYICIWTSFANTVQYLSSSVQALGKPVHLLTSALKLAEHMDPINAYRENGGILITTDAISEGLSLEYVDVFINYDLPLNTQMFEQRLGRFLRFGRKNELRMVVLKDKSKALIWEVELLKILEDTYAN